MKKYLLCLTMIMVLALSACSSDGDAPDVTTEEEAGTAEGSGTTEGTGEEAEETPLMGEFTAVDLEGNEVDETLFEGKTLTMMNIWATSCPPCLKEMPDLAVLADEYAEAGVQVVGIVSDVIDQTGGVNEDALTVVEAIIEETGADYTHLVPTQDLFDKILANVQYVPTSYFFDENGAQVGAVEVGYKNLEDWSKVVDALLEELT